MGQKIVRRPKDRQSTVVPLESSSLKREEVAVHEDPNHGNVMFSLLGVAFFVVVVVFLKPKP